jgi:hypothetical protein
MDKSYVPLLLFSASSDTSALNPARGVPISDGMSPISSCTVRYADLDLDRAVGNDGYDVGNDPYEDATDDGGRRCTPTQTSTRPARL